MTSKERAALKSQAVKIEPILQIGKAGITPELTEAVRETFHTRELTKIHILQTCTEDGRVLGQALADRTGSEVVQVIGRMIVLYKKNDELHQTSTKEDRNIQSQKRTKEKARTQGEKQLRGRLSYRNEKQTKEKGEKYISAARGKR